VNVATIGDMIGLMHGTQCVPNTGHHAQHGHKYLFIAMSHDGHRVLALSPEGWAGWFSVLAVVFSGRRQP